MTDDYCEHCELPLSTCIHGNPPTPPPEPVKAVRPSRGAAATRTRAAATPRGTAATKAAPPASRRRRTPSEDFEPWIVTVLGALGGEAPADAVMDAIAERMGESFRPGDQEQGPTGEVRWRTACRTARKHLADGGRLVAPQPGVWRLVD